MSQFFIGTTSGGLPVTVPTQFTGNVGIAVPAANNLNVIGTGDVLVTGSGSTLTISLTNVPVFAYKQINHASSPYTVLGTDYYISCDAAAGVISVLLPNAPAQFTEYIIKDRTGHANQFNISVTTVGGAVTIDGQTTYTMAATFSSIQLLFNGTSYEVF